MMTVTDRLRALPTYLRMRILRCLGRLGEETVPCTGECLVGCDRRACVVEWREIERVIGFIFSLDDIPAEWR